MRRIPGLGFLCFGLLTVSGQAQSGTITTYAQIATPSGVAADAAGNVFVYDYDAGRIRT